MSRQASKSDSKIHLVFWSLQMLTLSDYMHRLISTYEASHPNVKITWIDVPFSEGEKRALTSMLSDQTPDIINLNPDFSAVLASRGALLDMNQWVDDSARKRILPVAWQAASLGKQTFGLPWYLSSAITLYNAPMLKQAGLSAPPQTLAQLIPMAKAVHDKTGNYLLMPSVAQGGRFFRMLLQQDVPLWDAQQRHLIFADHGADKALALWVNLFRQGLMPPESLTEDQQATVDRYQSQTLGMLLTGPNFLNIIHENAPKIFAVTDVAPQFPQGKAIDFSEMVLIVPKRTAHPKEAVDFALYVTNATNTLALSKLAPVLPPDVQALQAPQFNQTHSSDLLTRARSISAQQLLHAKTAFHIHPMQNRLNQLMDFYVQSALLGKMTPAVAMQNAQHDMNKLLE